MSTLVLELRCDPELQFKVFKLKKGSLLRFTLNPDLKWRDVQLFTNYPVNSSSFERETFHHVPWIQDPNCKAWKSERYAEILIEHSGPFDFYYTCDPTLESSRGTFVVEPDVTIKGQVSPVEAITMQTVLAPCMGPFNEWSARLQVAFRANYNTIHFTPLQEIGSSRSGYSLMNHRRIDPRYYPDQNLSPEESEAALGKVLREIRHEQGAVLISDVVWNHASPDSEWLREHPECGYSLHTCPHLIPAYVLDKALAFFSDHVAHGDPPYQDLKVINNEGDIHRLIQKFQHDVIPALQLWEFFVIDIDCVVDSFLTFLESVDESNPSYQNLPLDTPQILYTQNPRGGRHSHGVEYASALIKRSPHEDKDSWTTRCTSALIDELQKENARRHAQTNQDIHVAMEHIFNSVKYERLDAHGPKLGPISHECPLVKPYFTYLGSRREYLKTKLKEAVHAAQIAAHPHNVSIHDLCKLHLDQDAEFSHVLAHSGWIWAGDPLVDFASPSSRAYLRREVIVWSDTIKLRYGNGPQANPFLWAYMAEYTRRMSQLFDGLRIDNCHSTPLHVGRYLLDEARKVNPNLYVMAELFSGSDKGDALYVNNMGLTTLIREAMNGYNAKSFSHLLHRHGGNAIGSFFDRLSMTGLAPLNPSVPHAMFMDVTHDNETPAQKHTAFNALPMTALLSVIHCGVGSTRGYDELILSPVMVVNEKRLYRPLVDDNVFLDPTKASMRDGILEVRAILNEIHNEASMAAFSDIFVDNLTDDVLSITRSSPSSHKSIVCVAHMVYSKQVLDNHLHAVPGVVMAGQITNVLLYVRQSYNINKGAEDPRFVTGSHIEMHVRKNVNVTDPQGAWHTSTNRLNGCQTLYLDHFPPGSIIVLEVSLPENSERCVGTIREQIMDASVAYGNLHDALEECTLLDFNHMLFRCKEEQEATPGQSGVVYNIPGHGPLLYCGLQGLTSLLEKIKRENDLGHPLCQNLRDGDWLIDYVETWIASHPSGTKLVVWSKPMFEALRSIPRPLIPSYFALILLTIYRACTYHAYKAMGPFIAEGPLFVKELALTSVQLYGLDAVHRQRQGDTLPSLAAGLPHFATDWARSWGRDTFISFRGLFLLTDRFKEAKSLIVTFAECIRHGLIPNLLDNGRSPRFNCRDAAWWFLQSIQDYVNLAPDGVALLHTPIRKRFPGGVLLVSRSGETVGGDSTHVTLADIVQEIMQAHATGIHFRERNAPSIDSNMSDPGFNVDIHLDLNNGFIYGGNKHNCGTWMDKMGESIKAGNKGVPATPRDGADVEIIALLKSAVSWLAAISDSHKFPYTGVALGDEGTQELTYMDWSRRIAANFERYFWIPIDESQDGDYAIQPQYVHRRGIYKDVVGSTHGYTDYQLRPNVAVAMVVAPELFTEENAQHCLSVMENALLGPLGMRTLDPEDWKYRGVYDQSNDSTDFSTSKGFCYHQGPEWVWCIGFFLRAKLLFPDPQKDEAREVLRILSEHEQHLQRALWKGIPELTNKDGAYCSFSCPVQAWSAACILEALYDLQNSA